jgi:hypothetical protein
MKAVQVLALCAAFWVAVFGFLGRAPEGCDRLRFPIGLALGALLAHLGWAALYLPSVWHDPWAVTELGGGFSVLFLPLGLMATAPWRGDAGRRDAYLGAALGCLPLAQAVARLGCLAAGCCLGEPTELPWGVGSPGDSAPRHPAAFYEIVGLLVLCGCLRGVARERVAGPVLVGLGAVRLVLEPWRAMPALGSPSIPPCALAASWILAGLAVHRAGCGVGRVMARPRQNVDQSRAPAHRGLQVPRPFR